MDGECFQPSRISVLGPARLVSPTFSPAMEKPSMPARSSRATQSAPSGDSWAKKPRVAMSMLWPRATTSRLGSRSRGIRFCSRRKAFTASCRRASSRARSAASGSAPGAGRGVSSARASQKPAMKHVAWKNVRGTPSRLPARRCVRACASRRGARRVVPSRPAGGSGPPRRAG